MLLHRDGPVPRQGTAERPPADHCTALTKDIHGSCWAGSRISLNLKTMCGGGLPALQDTGQVTPLLCPHIGDTGKLGPKVSSVLTLDRRSQDYLLLGLLGQGLRFAH